MDIFQIVAFGLIAAVLAVTVKSYHNELGIFVSLAAGIIIFLHLLSPIQTVLDILEDLVLEADVNLTYIETLLKIIGVAYVTEFGAQVCKDAGEGTIAKKIEFSGKVIIMLLAVPIIVMILDTVLNLLP